MKRMRILIVEPVQDALVRNLFRNYSGQDVFQFRQFRHEFDYLPVSIHTNRFRVDTEAKDVTPCR